MEPQQNQSGIGSIIGTILIIAIIILGGLYFWGKRIEESKAIQDLVTDTTPTESVQANEAASIKSVSSSDDLDSIQADLNATKLDNLSAEVQTSVQ